MYALFGFLIARTVWGRFAIIVFGIPLLIAVMAVALAALHITAFAIETLVGVVIALAMLCRVTARFGTVTGLTMHLIGVFGLVAAWYGLAHLPFGAHDRTVLAWGGFTISILRPAALVATMSYVMLAGYYVHRLLTWQPREI